MPGPWRGNHQPTTAPFVWPSRPPTNPRRTGGHSKTDVVEQNLAVAPSPSIGFDMPPKKKAFTPPIKDKWAPLYALVGEEPFLIEEALDQNRQAVLGRPDMQADALDEQHFDLTETSLAEIINAAKTVSMFAPRQFIVARDIHTAKADALAALLAYVGNPNPQTCLVLVGQKVDSRLKAFATLKKQGCLFSFDRLKDRELSAWIARRAKAQNLAITSNGARALGDAVGADLSRIAQSLEQLGFCWGGRDHRPTHVETLISETREQSVFDLTKAIFAGDKDTAMRLLLTMLNNREPALRIHFMLSRQLRQIWRTKEHHRAGLSRSDIAKAVGLPPFFIDDALGPAQRMSVAALARSHRSLSRADVELKSSRVPPELLMTRLVQQLLEDASGRRA